MKLSKQNERKTAPSLSSWFDEFWPVEDFFSGKWSGFNTFRKTPAVNIKDRENAYEIEVAAPGLTKDDFKVSIDHNILNISCEQEDHSKDQDDDYTREEFNYSAFSRSFSLPENVDTEDIEATYRNGVLLLKMKKLEMASSQGKTIVIN